MSTVDIIQSIGVITTLLFSVISIVQTRKANKKTEEANNIAQKANDTAEEANIIAKKADKTAQEANSIATEANDIANGANDIAQKALNDSQKDYMPLVTLIGEIKSDSKSIEELSREITFDFHTGITYNAYTELDFSEDDEFIPISFKIKNIGKGIIRKMKIESFLICFENKTSFDKKLDGDFELDIIFYESDCKDCEQEFVLCENDDIIINLLFSEEKCHTNTDNLNELIKKEDIFVMMELELFSTNESSYHQKTLWCNFEEGIAKLCSFDDVVSSSYEKFNNHRSKRG